MAEEIKRIPIYKYVKSGKLSGISHNLKLNKHIVVDMSPDLRGIQKIRSINFVKRESLVPTDYILEAVENIQKEPDDEYSVSYHFLRVLTSEDLDEERWKATKSLTDLPVSSHQHISKEERIWAGEREGNIGAGLVLSVWALATWWMVYKVFTSDISIGFTVFASLVSLVATFSLIVFKWQAPKKPSAEKLAELKTYKEQLRLNIESHKERKKTEIGKMLEDYSNWEDMSPKSFEHALTLKLENEGYDLNVTKYVGDGGIDLEGVNKVGEPVIVQAKKYKSNVGVAVVREMIGVRESHPEKPLTMIIALVGFTRGAKQLANQEGVILKSIKKDLLGV